MFVLRYGYRTPCKIRILFWLLMAAFTAVYISLARASDDHHHDHDHANEDHAEHEEEKKGPHGGRLLEQDDFALEITIFEAGVPPEFRVYAYDDHEPVNPAAVQLQIELQRLGGDTDLLQFTPAGDYLRGNGTVKEPHSFDVRVRARHSDKDYVWNFASYEGRTSIPAATAREAGVQTEIAGPARIRQTLMLYGTVRPDEERVLRLTAPYAGHVRAVHVSVGDRVRQGDLLAVIQSKESLATYTLKAPRSGLIISRHANPGEITDDEEALFVLADLSQVWIDFAAFPNQYGKLKAGQAVNVHGHGHDHIDQAKVRYIAPLGSSASQSILVRAVLDNTEEHWVPGLLVAGDVVIDESEVPLAVKTAALQSFRDFTVVFSRFGETYEVRMLELGRRDNEFVEILGGLKPGTEYVTANSYLIKADILKSGASHDH
jgi:cobalt-zinc-cadmium efflux system membrane fusion protein